MPAPKGNVLVVASRGEHLVVRMDGKAPQLSPMPEHHLIESPLKGSLQDVVPRRTHVNIPIVPPRPLWIDAAHTPDRLRQLERPPPPRSIQFNTAEIFLSLSTRASLQAHTHRVLRAYFRIRDTLVILQGIPGCYLTVLLTAGEQRTLRQHDQGADTFVVRLEFHADEVSAVRVHRVHGDETVAVRCYDIPVLFKLDAGHVRAGRLKRRGRERERER